MTLNLHLFFVVWDLRQRKHVFSSKKMEDYVSKILTNDEARYLVCTSGEGTVTSFDIAGKCVYIQVNYVSALFFSVHSCR